jgi:hypothetical protein
VAYLEGKEVCEAYEAATKEADQWRVDYTEFERLANNGLIEDLDESLPKVNDGSLAAALLKLPKRAVPKNLTGRAKALDRDDAWLTELANLQWENNIVPNATSQAPFQKKWEVAVHKAGIYGGCPVVNLFVTRGNYTGSDFIIPPNVQDVKLEAGKVSDLDSDVIFWDVYYTATQWKTMIEQAKEENKEKNGYNKWNVPLMQEILKAKPEDKRAGNEENSQNAQNGVYKTGIHCFIAFQRGNGTKDDKGEEIASPFTMYHPDHKESPVREWANPDPTGDTQNVLDYMRQADVLATQLGLQPPLLIEGDDSQTDYDSLEYTERAQWVAGNAKITRQDMADGVYSQIPSRVEMYLNSLNKIIPMGENGISAAAGDPLASKTPAGVKMQQANLSIDDEHIQENLFITVGRTAKSMINTHFANMQGADPIKVTDEERELLAKSGIEFPVDPMTGEPGNELVIEWEQARGTFDFEVDPEEDKSTDEAQQLDGLLKVAEFLSNPTTMQLMTTGGKMMLGTQSVDVGELIGTIVNLSTDNDKIVTEVTPDEMNQQAMLTQQAAQQPQIDPATGQPVQPAPVDPTTQAPAEAPIQQPVEGEVMPQQGMEAPQDNISPEQAQANVEAVMQAYQVDKQTAAGVEAERQGYTDEEISTAFGIPLELIMQNSQQQEPVNVQG